MKKVVLFTNTMTAGGAERVMSNMANFLSAKGEIEVIFLTSAVTNDFYELDKGVRRLCLDQSTNRVPLFLKPFRFVKRLFKLRALLREEAPDAVISFLENVNLLNALACLGQPVRSIISMRNDPRKNNIGPLLSLMRSVIYPLADLLVVQTKSVLDWCYKRSISKNIIVVPNSVRIPNELWKEENVSCERFRFLAAGRLVNQKGFDMLIRAARILKDKKPNFKLDIYGDGPQRSSLESMIDEFFLGDEIELKGLTDNLHNELLASNCFVLSSRYEGFPNVLLEAMSLGVPSISFDCQSGPSDIIEDYVDGILVKDGDVEELAEKMNEMIMNAPLREKLHLSSRESIKRFEISRIMLEWESLF